MKMKGWKTWTGAALVGIAAVLEFLGKPGLSSGLMMMGASLGLVGIGHKIEKSANGRAACPKKMDTGKASSELLAEDERRHD